MLVREKERKRTVKNIVRKITPPSPFRKMQTLQSYLRKEVCVIGGEGSQPRNSTAFKIYLLLGFLSLHIAAKVNKIYFP